MNYDNNDSDNDGLETENREVNKMNYDNNDSDNDGLETENREINTMLAAIAIMNYDNNDSDNDGLETENREVNNMWTSIGIFVLGLFIVAIFASISIFNAVAVFQKDLQTVEAAMESTYESP